MLDLNDFFYFVHIVDRGGFTAAGRTLNVPKSTLSHRMQQLESNLGVRLLYRTSRRFGMTHAGEEFYQHAVSMLKEAELAENSVRNRLNEPSGTVRCTTSMATMQFALADIITEFLAQQPKVDVFAHSTDRVVDIVGENFDIAIRAHTAPLPDSDLIQKLLTPAPWFLFAGIPYINRHGTPKTPHDLGKHPSLFMRRGGSDPVWRLRHSRLKKDEVIVALEPRMQSNDMVGLQQAAIKGLGIVALPGFVCRSAVQAGLLQRVLPDWVAEESFITALMPYRKGMLPSVRAFLDHLTVEFPKLAVL